MLFISKEKCNHEISRKMNGCRIMILRSINLKKLHVFFICILSNIHTHVNKFIDNYTYLLEK